MASVVVVSPAKALVAPTGCQPAAVAKSMRSIAPSSRINASRGAATFLPRDPLLGAPVKGVIPQRPSKSARRATTRANINRPEYIPNRIDDPTYVRVFDTTLRDGEQSPGASLTSSEKLAIAKQLAKLGVDIIEAGFPTASPDDLEAVRTIAIEVGNNVDETGHVPVICGLSRANKKDIDAAWEAVRHAKRPRIHTFIATSPIHMEHKLRKTPDEVVEIAVAMVKYARSLGCNDVEFSPEDAGRSDPVFLYRILGEVIKAGATTLNIPETVGYSLPDEYSRLIKGIYENVPGIKDVVVSTHCHNDLGLATATTLAGVLAGARQVEVTVNGIGERAGNASLEELTMILKSRSKWIGGLRTGIHTQNIALSSRMVAEYTGMMVQPHKAIVGANAFAHESGIHQDGMLKNKDTYEIMSPEDIGLVRRDEAGLVLGKLSGRAALKAKLKELGYDELDQGELDEIFSRFKKLADKKKNVTDSDIEALVADELYQPDEIWRLGDLQVVSGTANLATATVVLFGPDNTPHMLSAIGNGPVDAAYRAIDGIVGRPVTLLEYSMNSVTAGIDALAHTRVLIRARDTSGSTQTHAQSGTVSARSWSGTGASEDVVVASARAYINALNKLVGHTAAGNAIAGTRTVDKTEGASV
eukprot:jgi/Mesvir1/2856/Mv13943-RA.1